MDSSILKRDMPRFKEMYIIEAKVGEGTFGVVYKVPLALYPPLQYETSFY